MNSYCLLHLSTLTFVKLKSFGFCKLYFLVFVNCNSNDLVFSLNKSLVYCHINYLPFVLLHYLELKCHKKDFLKVEKKNFFFYKALSHIRYC
jgi:hypothetical protein